MYPICESTHLAKEKMHGKVYTLPKFKLSVRGHSKKCRKSIYGELELKVEMFTHIGYVSSYIKAHGVQRRKIRKYKHKKNPSRDLLNYDLNSSTVLK